MAEDYPTWLYYPNRAQPPAWVETFIEVVCDQRPAIESAKVDHLTSDAVLSHLAPGLAAAGYVVETGKKRGEKVRRPVLFGEQGRPRVTYEVDAVHDELGIVVEVEAGRGARGNAIYRDLIRTSLIVDVNYLALGVMLEYRHLSGGRRMAVRSFQEARDQVDAIYASGQLHLPFEGLLLFGY
ncbi:hypothetical protein ACI78V_02180 [Geodermatophilus sp. SYSU D00742]